MRTRPLVVSIVFVLLLVGGVVAGFTLGNTRPLLGLDLVGGLRVTLEAPEGTSPELMERALETIRNRVDAFGVAEPDIAIVGERFIEVQIPELAKQVGGAAEQTRLRELIGRTARLEQRQVLQVIGPQDPAYAETEVTCEDRTVTTGECSVSALEDQEVVFLEDSEDPEPTKLRLGQVEVTGDMVRRASAVFDTGDQSSAGEGWVVSFQLTNEGTDIFAELTERLVNEQPPMNQLAIVVDRLVESAPSVNEPITGGRGQISGSFTEQEAKDLALTLQSGALPVELTTGVEETVSPTLGEESLRAGLLAGIVGLVILALYLAFYYRLLGIVTWVGMTIWATLALGIVSLLGRWVGYSLTLAGIAGFIVSIGIAGDSYIVFYERLKDEVRHGKSPRAAVLPAFRQAWKTIVAANLVTILAAVVLYVLAIGSVRGFALTLGISTGLDLFVVWFFKRPAVILLSRSRRLSNLRGFGLRSGIAADPAPEPVAVGAK
ncbi:MAG: protein translocase subunit SecD [Actinomycetota bacterium]